MQENFPNVGHRACPIYMGRYLSLSSFIPAFFLLPFSFLSLRSQLMYFHFLSFISLPAGIEIEK